MPPESRAQQRYVTMIDVQIDDPIHTREAISAIHAYCCYSTRGKVSAGVVRSLGHIESLIGRYSKISSCDNGSSFILYSDLPRAFKDSRSYSTRDLRLDP